MTFPPDQPPKPEPPGQPKPGKSRDPKETHYNISGIVARRDGLPYVHMDINGKIYQLSMAQARKIAMDLLSACGYAEADAIIFKFFGKREFPEGAAAALMVDFREFRRKLSIPDFEKSQSDPDTGEIVP